MASPARAPVFRVKLGPWPNRIDELEAGHDARAACRTWARHRHGDRQRGGGDMCFDVLLQERGRPGKRAVAGRGSRTDHHRDAGRRARGAARGRSRPWRRRRGRGRLAPATPAANALDEFFVDPAEFRKKKDLSAGTPPAAATVTEHGTDLVDLFSSPEQFRRSASRSPAAPRQPWPQPRADLHDAAMPGGARCHLHPRVHREDRPAGQPGGRTGDHRGHAGAQQPLAEAGNDGRYSTTAAWRTCRGTRATCRRRCWPSACCPISNVFQRFPRVVHELSAAWARRSN